MSLAWHAIHDNLLHSSRTLTFQRHFDLIRHTGAGLAALGDPAALLDALHRQTASADSKNDCLKSLVRAAQGDWAEADTALTLLLLALWPGLDAIRRRSLRRRIGAPADITSEILARATEALRRLDLGRVNWIAATVLKNIERDMIRDTRSDAHRQRVTSTTVPEDVADERPEPTLFHQCAAQRLMQALGAYGNILSNRGDEWYRPHIPTAARLLGGVTAGTPLESPLAPILAAIR